MEGDDEIDIIIDEIKPCKSKSGFYFGESSNKINDDASDKLIEPKENNNKKECTFCSFNLNGWFSIINLIAGALGGGIFSFPKILYNIGMASGLICFILVSVSVYYSLDLLRRFVVDTKLFSYSDITKATLGYFWLIMFAISSFIVYLSCISSYLDILYGITQLLIPQIKEIHVVTFFYFFITYIIEVLLCIFTSNLSKIHILSTICVCIFIIILIIVIVEAIIRISNGNKNGILDYVSAFEIKDSLNKWENFLSIMSKLNEYLVGFLSHSTFPTLLNFYHSPNDDEKTKKINKVFFIILNIIYGLYTIFAYFCLDKQNIVNIQVKVGGKADYIIDILLMIYLLALVPIRYIIIRDNYTSVLKKDYLPAKIDIPITCVCLLICNIIACFVGEHLITKIFMNIFMGIFGVFISFILPVINFVKLNDKSKLRSIIGYIISGIFILIGIFSIIFLIKTNWK